MEPGFASYRPPGQSLRVMTYNIHRWAGQDGRLDVPRLAHVIRTSGAQVVGLNEVIHPVTLGECTCEPLAELAERLGMQHVFGPSGWLDYGPGWYGPLGNALLCRYPLREVTNIVLPRLQGTKQRSLLRGTLAAGPAQGLTAFVTHLDHAFEGTRLVQIRAVLRHLPSSCPHYLGGDLNTPGFVGRRSRYLLPPVLRMLQRYGYYDAFHVAGEGHGRTYPAVSPVFRLDFLFLPARCAEGLRSARAVNTRVSQFASDHRPVVADLSLPFEHGDAKM